MACGAALYFDEETDAAVRGLWQAIEDAGLPSSMLQLSYPPHLSILTCENVDVAQARKVLPEFIANHPPLPVTFHSLGMFRGEEAIFFLAPVANRALLDFHAELWNLLTPYLVDPSPLYQPGHWVPHVTIDLNVPPEQVSAVTNWLMQASFPRQGLLKALFIGDFSEAENNFEELYKARLGSYQ